MQLYKLDFPNGKSYIGITSKTAQERFKEHCYKAKKRSPCQLAIHKYGKENIVINVLAECNDWELLCLAEIEAIEKFNTKTPYGYNLTDGGEGLFGYVFSESHRKSLSDSGKSRYSAMTVSERKIAGSHSLGRKHSESTRKKISEKAKGRIASKETREKLSKIHKGVLRTEEHKKKISLALKDNMSDENRKKLSLSKKGVPRSAETIKKMSDANLGKKQSEETRRKRSESMKATIALKKHTLIAEKIKDLIEALHVIESIEEN